MCKHVDKEEIVDYAKFEKLHWAIKRHKEDPKKYRHPKDTCLPSLWNRWTQDANLREFIGCRVRYSCFWTKHNREVLCRAINDGYWDLQYDDSDLFELNQLFFENDGDAWKVYKAKDDRSTKDLFDLNYLFREFSVRPDECGECCRVAYDVGPFESDYDLCEDCYCCNYLWRLHEEWKLQDSKWV